MAPKIGEAGSGMIAPADVGLPVFCKVESSMRHGTRQIMEYDWYNAGRVAGTAPTEWEMVVYGREHALAWTLEGTSVYESVGLGFQAMYDLAYSDIRDSIRGRNGTRRAATATSTVDVYSHAVAALSGSESFELFDLIARSPLSISQQKIVSLYCLGWSLPEVAEDLGFSLRSCQRWFKASLPVLKGQMR